MKNINEKGKFGLKFSASQRLGKTLIIAKKKRDTEMEA